MARLRVGQVLGRHQFRVELLLFSEVSVLEAAAVYLVDLIKLATGLGFECSERPDGLRGQGAPIHEEKDASSDAGLEETIRLVHHREGLSRSSRHGHEEMSLPLGDRLLDP